MRLRPMGKLVRLSESGALIRRETNRGCTCDGRAARARLVVCLATGLVLGATSASCGGGKGSVEAVETSVFLSVAPAVGAPLPENLALNVYDEHGVVWPDRRLPPSGPLVPASDELLGTLAMFVPEGTDELRIEVRGVTAGETVAQGLTRVQVIAERQVQARVVLAVGLLTDVDGDGVPDEIDVCPTVPDGDQTDSDGEVPGDACDPTRDAGVDAGDGGGGLDGAGGGGGVDGGAVDGGGDGSMDAAGDGPVDLAPDGPASDAARDVPADSPPDTPKDAGEASLKPSGSVCGVAVECASGNCVDGYCCTTACTEECQSCARPGIEGSCAFEAAGAPCGAGTCIGSKAVGAGSCGAAGECMPTSSEECAPYACNTATGNCRNACTLGAHCVSPAVCRSDQTCGSKKLDGSPCGTGSECDSGHCADFYCCATACSALCMTCGKAGSEGSCVPVPEELPDSNSVPSCSGPGLWCDGAGGCNKPTGAACSLALECESGSCPDGTCT